MKQAWDGSQLLATCRSSLRRGAWIETQAEQSQRTTAVRRSSLRRGAWIETAVDASAARASTSRSSLRRGAWIETVVPATVLAAEVVAPLFGGGRGLKQAIAAHDGTPAASLLSSEGGVD